MNTPNSNGFSRIRKLTQRLVDERRTGILTGMLVKAVRERNPRPGVHHVRFRRPDVTTWEVREGNPPPDVVNRRLAEGDVPPMQTRFPWEKGLNLVLDLGYIKPETALHVMKLIKEREMSANKMPDWKIPEIAQHTVNLMKQGDKQRMELPDVPAKPRTIIDIARDEEIEILDRRSEILRRYEKYH